MGYVALKRLKWGDRFIEPGEAVPDGDEGRSYQSLVFHGQIGPLKDPDEMSDAELTAEVERLTMERDEACERIEELEAGDSTEVEVPDGVTPGETPGWPIDITTGDPVDLTDDQRTALAEKGISGAVVFTHTGEIVVIDPPEGAETETEEADVADDKRVEIKKPEDPASDKKTPAKSNPAQKQAGK